MIADGKKEQQREGETEKGEITKGRLTGTMMEMSMMETLQCDYYDQTEKTTRDLAARSFKC